MHGHELHTTAMHISVERGGGETWKLRLDDNLGNQAFVAALTSTDADIVGTNPAIFSITGGANAASFHVVTAADGSQSLQFVTAPDYETSPHRYQVQVSAFDGVHTTEQTISVDLSDVNDNPPTITTAATQSVAEN